MCSQNRCNQHYTTFHLTVKETKNRHARRITFGFLALIRLSFDFCTWLGYNVARSLEETKGV
jgi:hypothetical protein